MGKRVKKLKAGIYRRGNSIILDRVLDGQRLYKKLPGDIPVTLAERILAKSTADILERRYFPVKSGRSLTVEQGLNFYWSERIEPKIKRLEANGPESKLKNLKDSKYVFIRVNKFFGRYPIESLTVATVEQYKARRQSDIGRHNRLVGPRSINRELEILTFALNWLVKTRRISENPIRGFEKLPLPDPKKIMFDNGHADGPEWQTFFKHVSDSHKDLLLCLYETGCRPGEVFQMRWEWVNQFERSILIPAEVAKTGKARKVPMSAKLFQALSKRPGTNELVFPNPKTGKPYRSVRKAFRGALKRSGLEGKGLTVYSIRRTRLSIWNQVDAIAAMQASGHSLNGSIHYKHYVNVDDRVFGLVKAG